MDIKDVSERSDLLRFMEQIKAGAERAARRKGETPRDHPAPQFLVFRFMMNLQQKDLQLTGTAGNSTNSMLYTTQVPAPYHPSVQPVNTLRPLMISKMALETHHRGRKIVVRALTPPDRLTAITAIIEDEEGTAVLLQLYNQPEEAEVNKQNILQQNSVFIIKEPYFKDTTDGSYSLRVDHVSDIIYLSDDDERIPRKWRKRMLAIEDDSQQLRMHGNSAVQKSNWAEAENLYSSAIRAATTAEQDQLAHLNRSLANLKLGRPEKALEDASRGSDSRKASEKGLFREARALYVLGKFDLCLEKFQALFDLYPHNKDAMSEIGRVKQRLREQQTGAYKFSEMYKQAKATPPIIDCATYIGPVDVRPSSGRGKGLFTTKPVKAGELLLCEKAFSYSYSDSGSSTSRHSERLLMNLSTKKMTMGGQAYLLAQTVQKLYHNPGSSDIFTELHHGDYQPVSHSEVDGRPVVDSFLVERIINFNCFGAPRASRQLFEDRQVDVNSERAQHGTCGIWPLASRINHSCLINCYRSFIGDMQIVRATQDLDADTELVFFYNMAPDHASYSETQKAFSSWGFTCSCRLCLDKKSTSMQTIRRRKALSRDIEVALQSHNSSSNLAKTRRLLEQLEKTYPTGEGVLRTGLWGQYLVLGKTYNHHGRPSEAIEMTVKGLEALGYAVLACPPGKASKEPVLKILKWGQAHEWVVEAFNQLSEAYRKLSPQLSVAARQYAELSYSICCGEKESFSSVYGELIM